jgi:hypothetical protein
MLKTQNYSIDNFIGIFDNYLPSIAIDKSIEWFEKEEKQKNSFDRLSQGHTENCKKDTSVVLHFKQNDGWLQEIPGLVENLMFAVGIYLERVPLKSYLNYEDLEFNTMKIQKTLPGEGYHMWHVEASDNLELLKRVIAFSVYLNDVEDGGETEFLYQSVRVKPVKGRIAIWPAFFPYVHRGNPPLKNEKYILTSWLSGRYRII